jgi:hypothetical protein
MKTAKLRFMVGALCLGLGACGGQPDDTAAGTASQADDKAKARPRHEHSYVPIHVEVKRRPINGTVEVHIGEKAIRLKLVFDLNSGLAGQEFKLKVGNTPEVKLKVQPDPAEKQDIAESSELTDPQLVKYFEKGATNQVKLVVATSDPNRPGVEQVEEYQIDQPKPHAHHHH